MVINKNPEVSPVIAIHPPLSRSLVHLAGGATAFFCALFVSAQTLDSEDRVSAFTHFFFQFSIFLLFILFLLIVSTTMEVVSSFPFFFSGHELVSNSLLLQCQTPPLLFFSLLALPEFSNYPSPGKDTFGILSFSLGLRVNKGGELCDCV